MRKRLRAFAYMVRISFRAAPWLFVRTLGLQIIESIASPLWALWMKVMADAIIAGKPSGAIGGGIALGASMTVNVLANIGRFNGEVLLQERVAFAIDKRLMELTAGTPGLDHHERPEYRDELALVRTQRQQLAGSAGALVYNVQMIVLLLASVGLLATVHPVMLVLPVLAVPSIFTAARTGALAQRALETTAERGRSIAHLFDVATSPAAGKELRVFGLGHVLLDRHRAVSRDVDTEQTRAGMRGALLSIGGWLVFAAGYIASIGVVAALAASGRATAGDVLMGLILGTRINSLVAGAVANVLWLVRSLDVVGRMLWLVDHEREARAAYTGTAPPPARLARGVRFEGVSFAYPGTDRSVLRDVDLELPAGATVAIVGENGAGKSTLVKLLCRFYEPASGRIDIDGVPLTEIDVDAWRARVAAGFQDFARFELIARESVGVGDLAQIDDDSSVAAALSRAGASDVIRALPDGLETQLGRTFDGAELSGGQWQKLALGRAMMREDPLLLVLDEPTASLDAETEHALFERYAGAASSLTGGITILVSHRFSTVRMADLIVVIDDGRVIESGTHDELVANGGLYAELYALQARAYR